MKKRKHESRGLKVVNVLLAIGMLVMGLYGYFVVTGLNTQLEQVQEEYAELNASYQDLNAAYCEVLNYAEKLESDN